MTCRLPLLVLILLRPIPVSASAEPYDHTPGTDPFTPADARQYSSPEPTDRGAASDSTIAAIVAAVEPDSLESVIAQLSGEVPVDLGWGPLTIDSRYFLATGAHHAAELLRRELASYGYEVRLDYFRFGAYLEEIVLAPSGVGFIVGAKGTVLRSVDGSAWFRARGGIETYEEKIRDVDQISADDYVIVGSVGLIATTADGGQQWTIRPSGGSVRHNAVDVRASGYGWVVGGLSRILVTTDAGTTWDAQDTALPTVMLHDVVTLDDRTVVAVGDLGNVTRTTNGGGIPEFGGGGEQNWLAVPSGTSSDLRALAAVGSNVWAVGHGGTILSSTDEGASWSQQVSGTTSNLIDVSFADASNGWAVGASGTILSTSNGGGTWTPVASPAPTFAHVGVHAVSATEIWIVGTVGLLVHTTDGGVTWDDGNPTIEDGSANVVATKAGTTAPDEEVLLIGHYDSIVNSGNPEIRAPGADDNASGTAALVEAARVMADARFERTIRFVAIGEEEAGFIGSNAYAQEAENLGTEIVGVFNVDTVGWNNDYLRILSNPSSAWLGDIALAMASTYAPTLPAFHWDCSACNWGDHWSFWQHGFDAIIGIQSWEPPPPHYHTRGDTLGILDLNLVTNVTRIALSTVATVAGVDTTDPTSVTAVGPPAPRGVQLHAGVPNPTRATVEIRFDLLSRERVQLLVYDLNGRRVRSLLDGLVGPGHHQVIWDGKDSAGRQVSAGVYFLHIKAGEQQASRKMVRVL